MKTLLRHATTGKYFQALDKWTLDRDNAHDFGIVRRALKFAKKARIPDLELVLSVDEPRNVTNTPFGEFIHKAMQRTRARRSEFSRKTLLRVPRWRPMPAF